MRERILATMAEVEVSKTTTTETRNEGRTSSLLTDILTIVGFAILFIIIIWGFVHLVSLIYTSLSSKFSNTAPSIEVTAPAQATSGQPMTISWTYSPSVQGSYAFLYQCENGLSFDTKGATSSVAVPCGEAYTVGNVNNSLTLTPLLSSASTATDTVSIVFIPSGTGSQAQGDATVAISAAAKSAPAKTTPAKTTSSATYTAPQYSGPTDLSVRIISGNVDASGAGVVTFDIANIGGSASGSYYFTAQLPTAQPYPYQSPLQASLEPGGHVTSTLRFTSVQSGGGTFSVSIQTNDANNADNYASMQLTAPYNYNNYNYNYSYPYNYQSSPYIVYPTYTY